MGVCITPECSIVLKDRPLLKEMVHCEIADRVVQDMQSSMCIHSDTVLIELYQQETYVTPKRGINMLGNGQV